MIKKLLPFFFFINILNVFSQEKNKIISGQVLDSLGVVKNSNIINLKTNQGTFSLDDGSFRISVSIGDSLQISSVQHITRKISINEKNIENKSIKVILKPNTYVLDEFELKKNHLMGRLGVDIKDVPTDKKDSLLRNVMDFSNVDFKQIDFRIDANIRAKPIIVNTVANTYSGLKIGKLLSKLNPLKKKKRSRFKNEDEDLNQKEAFPAKLLSELGNSFFFEKLKIPKEKYFHFLEYCKQLDIEKLYKENKILDIIEILQKESVSYLKTIKEK